MKPPHFGHTKSGLPVHLRTEDNHGGGINGKIALGITALVGTMLCAYVFGIIALVSLPAAIASGSVIVIVSWVAQTFLQLVLLAVILVGQNVQGRAADTQALAPS